MERNRHGPNRVPTAGLVALLLAITTALAACERTPPAAPLALPTLERPTLKLTGKPDGQRVLVPTSALVERGGIPGTFVLTPAAAYPPVPKDLQGMPLPQARFRMVKTGKTVGRQIEILSGLVGDEVLVVGDLSGVRDGSPIKTVANGS